MTPSLSLPTPLSLRRQFLALPTDWQALLQKFIGSAACKQLCTTIDQARNRGTRVYPDKVFFALHTTAVEEVRVIILGQDPYHGVDPYTGQAQAHGLAFSVPPGAKPPPSLSNIFKELQRDLGVPIPQHGNLTAWAKQGVLLLNTILTVVADEAASHANLFSDGGWEACTDELLKNLAHYHAARQRKLIVMLWGSYARAKADLFSEHIVLQTTHPSPLSAYRGFFGCGHFGLANEALIAAGQAPITWRLPEEVEVMA